MDYKQESLKKHFEWKGKIEMAARAGVDSKDDLSLAYTPGVAQPCLEIQKNPELSFSLTRRWNTVAVVTDGTAVLGLGDIGPEAAMPVMEGKALLFKQFADVDAIPLCIASKDVDEIVNTVTLLQGSFGGINLEDIAAPRCFEIERRLKESCSIPVFHDDQHGTAVVVLAGLMGALKVTGRTRENCNITICGAGSAGTAIAKLLITAGFGDIVMVDKDGIITEDVHYQSEAMNDLAAITNKSRKSGTLSDALRGADIFIGVSAANIVSEEDVRSMNADPIIFAMANPDPEIMPEKAKAAGAAVVATGRSDYPNQINNLLAFPGIFRGALDARAKDISEEMKLAAAAAINDIISDEELSAENIIPSPLDKRVAVAVAEAVAAAAGE